jgi:ribosomal protein L29
MVLDGIARVRGRDPAVLRAPSPQELQRTIAALHAELRQLRATVEGGHARVPELAA